MFFDFVAIVFSEFSDMLVDNVVTCNRARTFVYGFIILSENVVRWQIMNALVTLEFFGKEIGARDNVADIFDIAFKHKRFGEVRTVGEE